MHRSAPRMESSACSGMLHASTCLCRVMSNTFGRTEGNGADGLHSVTAGIDFESHASSQSMYLSKLVLGVHYCLEIIFSLPENPTGM